MTAKIKNIMEKIKDFSEAIPMGRPIGVNPPTPKTREKVQVGFTAPEIPLSKAEKSWKKVEMTMDKFFKWIDSITPKIIKWVRRFILGVLIWFVLGYFIPPLRESMPDFFRFVDGTLWCLNECWKKVFQTIEGLMSSFGG